MPFKPSHIAIVTGASRGLGLAMAQQLLSQPGTRLLTLSRQGGPVPAGAGSAHEHWTADLADPVPLAGRLGTWLRAALLDAPADAGLTLIHNAALLTEPVVLAASDPAELSQAMRVNTEAPLVLSAAFLAATQTHAGLRRLLFISSGLARRAMAGAAPYCAAKAALDHLARALALEEALRPNGARVCSLAPGVIATDMQVQLRGADPTLFPEQARFAALHSSGALDSPAAAAAKVLAYLGRADFGANPVADVREA